MHLSDANCTLKGVVELLSSCMSRVKSWHRNLGIFSVMRARAFVCGPFCVKSYSSLGIPHPIHAAETMRTHILQPHVYEHGLILPEIVV